MATGTKYFGFYPHEQYKWIVIYRFSNSIPPEILILTFNHREYASKRDNNHWPGGGPSLGERRRRRARRITVASARGTLGPPGLDGGCVRLQRGGRPKGPCLFFFPLCVSQPLLFLPVRRRPQWSPPPRRTGADGGRATRARGTSAVAAAPRRAALSAAPPGEERGGRRAWSPPRNDGAATRGGWGGWPTA